MTASVGASGFFHALRTAMAIIDEKTDHPEIWRRQCARNIMDCYVLGMETLLESNTARGKKDLDLLTRLMSEGMTVVRNEKDEHVFYSAAARSCRECAKALEGTEKTRLFRIYASIFEDMSNAVLSSPDSPGGL